MRALPHLQDAHGAGDLAALLARARKAGVTVAYGTRAHHKSHWLPEVAPTPGDIQIENQAQDRFYNTDLDKMLKAKGIATLILVGWKVSGSVTYTSVGATLRGYTVVVPVDASLDASDFEIAVGRHQILNQNSANADERTFEEQGLDAEPHRYDRVQVVRGGVRGDATQDFNDGRNAHFRDTTSMSPLPMVTGRLSQNSRLPFRSSRMR